MFGEYAGRLLADKADKGHNDTQTPSSMHAKMVTDFRGKLEALVGELKAREARWSSKDELS